MQTVIEREKPKQKVSLQDFKDFQIEIGYPLKRSNEYNLKNKLDELLGIHEDFSGKLETVNLVLGILISFALIFFTIL
jgi:hypothetical protein